MVHEIMAMQCASSALHEQVAGSTTVSRWICHHFHEKCLFRRAVGRVFDIGLCMEPLVEIYLFDALQSHFEYIIGKILVCELNGT
jgi:hypothetical protein